MASILALGDCNMSGDKLFHKNAYAERFADKIKKTLKNAGYTMSTTREMKYFFNDFFQEETEIILIQYGLVDSWKTFKYAPYVLYYPDSRIRKIYRKLVKKYKKTAKSLGLNRWLGEMNVVPLEEYAQNIRYVIEKADDKKIVLIETIPNKQKFRNSEIMHYNKVLHTIAKEYRNVEVLSLYDDFIDKMDEYYLDQTHMNEQAYRFVANKLLRVYEKMKVEAV